MEYNKYAGDDISYLDQGMVTDPILWEGVETIEPVKDYSSISPDVMPPQPVTMDEAGQTVTLPKDNPILPADGGGIDKKWLWIGAGVLALFVFRKQIFGK